MDTQATHENMKYVCECGSIIIITKSSINRHLKTKKHLSYTTSAGFIKSPTAALMRDAITHHFNLMRQEDLWDDDKQLQTNMYYGIVMYGEWLKQDDEDNYVYKIDNDSDNIIVYK